MTVGSKLDGYGYESNSGFHFLYMFYGVRLSASYPTAHPGGPGYPFLSGSPTLTYLARDAIPLASLPPAQLSGSFDHTSPTNGVRQMQKCLIAKTTQNNTLHFRSNFR